MAEGQPIPSVLIGSDGPPRKLTCDYKNVSYMFAEQEQISVSKMFSSFANMADYDLFVFMSQDYDFTSLDSLTNLVNHFMKEEFIHIGAMYSDIGIKVNNKHITLKPYQSFHYSLFDNNIMVNIPFICKSSISPKFTDSIESLFLYDGLISLSKTTRVFHMANRIFSLQSLNPSNNNIKLELDLINKTHGQKYNAS